MHSYRAATLLFLAAITVIAITSSAKTTSQDSRILVKLYIYPNACIRPEIVVPLHGNSSRLAQVYTVTTLREHNGLLEVKDFSRTVYRYPQTLGERFSLVSNTSLARRGDVLQGYMFTTYSSRTEHTTLNLSISITFLQNNTVREALSGTIETSTSLASEKPGRIPGGRILEYRVEKIGPNRYYVRAVIEAQEPLPPLLPLARYIPLPSLGLAPSPEHVTRLVEHIRMTSNESYMVTENRVYIVYNLSINQYVLEHARLLDTYFVHGAKGAQGPFETLASDFLENFSLGHSLGIVVRENTSGTYIELPLICSKKARTPHEALAELENLIKRAETLLNTSLTRSVVAELEPGTDKVVIRGEKPVSLDNLSRVNVTVRSESPSPMLVSLTVATAIAALLLVVLYIMTRNR